MIAAIIIVLLFLVILGCFILRYLNHAECEHAGERNKVHNWTKWELIGEYDVFEFSALNPEQRLKTEMTYSYKRECATCGETQHKTNKVYLA